MKRYIALVAVLAMTATEIAHDYVDHNILPERIIKKFDSSDLKCLATMVYGEARGESYLGKIAVAFSAINRKTTKKTICDIVLAPKQYSIFNGNDALKKVALEDQIEVAPHINNTFEQEAWQDSIKIAEQVLNGDVDDPTSGATHYLADKVMKIKKYHYPKWSRTFTQVATIDNHRFFKEVK